ncbi:MAG: hypothetical protein A7315_11395 [Candidatus Altiarchaeales archaeon WOR_SM1_79]|nr:MAG: hypothetical protein A7315_11395 [Candidatus Altiarchaeales archaeon WOR_SM1_79]
MEGVGPFTRKLWMTAQPVYEQIINCAYIKRLADGTLPHKWFAHYLSQDVLYIIDDSKALAVTAARAPNPDEMYFFLQLAKDGLDIERALHKEFIQLFNIPKAIEKSPAFNAYTDFLINNAFNSPYPVAVAALLPCFWIYYKTGEYVLNNTVNNNPYRKWIDTYSGDEYKQYTKRFIYITENLGQKASPIIREQMENAFIEGTKHELRVLEEASKQ